MIVTIPLSRSSTIREIRATERNDGNYESVEVLFVNGGGERFGFVASPDLHDVIYAESVGKMYWQVFRRKYK